MQGLSQEDLARLVQFVTGTSQARDNAVLFQRIFVGTIAMF